MIKGLTFRRLLKRDLVLKDVFTVLTGNVVAQLILISATLIYARIYSAEDFGEFTVFFAISAIIVQIVNLRYEQAIVMAEDDELNPLFTFLFLTTILVGCFSIGFASLLSKVGLFKLSFITRPSSQALLIVYVIFSGIWNCCQYALIRNSEYKRISVLAVIRSSAIVITTCLFVFFSLPVNGMIAGLSIGQLVGTLASVYLLKKKNNLVISWAALKQSAKAIRRFKQFPLYQFPSVLIESVSGQLLAFYLSLTFPLAVLGYFSLANRTVNAPMDLIGGAVRTVFWEKASKEVKAIGNCYQLFVATFKKLAIIAAFPSLVLFFAGEFLFRLVFGSEWAMAGTFAGLLSFMLFFRFLSSPLSSMFAIRNKQGVDLIIQAVIFVAQYLCFFKLKLFSLSAENVVLSFAVIYSFKYLLELYFSYIFSKGEK